MSVLRCYFQRRSDRHSCVTATIAVIMLLAGFGCAPEDTAKVAGTPDAGYRTLSEAEYEDKVAGGWLGQAVGVLYGFPTEFLWPGEMVPFDFDDWYRMKPEIWLEEGLSVLEKDGYVAMIETRKKYKNDINNWETYTPRQMPPQDDLYIEFLFLHSLQEHGLHVTAEQMAEDWVSYLDPNMIWGANRVAYQNFKKGILPPRSGHPDNTPLGNAIDFQIESDLFGLISPGLPRASNALGDKAGHLTNYGDGVYAGMAMAAMYGEAFFESDPRKLVEHSLAVIPRASGYAEMVRDVIAAHDANPGDWQAAWEAIFAKWGQYLGLDVRSNGACVYLGLLYGGGDFLKTMNISMRCGLDSDCNPSSAAGIIGAVLGMSGIPDKWTILRRLPISNASHPGIYLGDTPIRSASAPGAGGQTLREIYPDPIDWDDIIAATVEVGHKNIVANGGRIEDGIIYIPIQTPSIPPFEQVPVPEQER
ncbi:MAG: ADP-ribosylglycohydrolase family protein [Gammaproteobacteria bacterium]|nr:ADP-ribosylglycohydrolase family protein [Gammaproteobacteria bacterium]